jgi:hypothetical protein
MQTLANSARRRAIGQLAEFAGVMTLVGAGGHGTAQAAAEDPHLAWYAEERRLMAYLEARPDRDRDLGELPEWHRVGELIDLIADTPANTIAGLAVQAHVLAMLSGLDEPIPSEGLAETLIAHMRDGLDRLAGRA